MNTIIGTILMITLLLFTIIICIANVNKQIVWSYIVFGDEEDYEDNDLDEYYE